jgi:transcriptional regulator GlxA family with amidase domain
VARAVDYIHENLGEPITLADLVRESGVAGRTLLKHFHDFKGVSPMRYLRNLRLKRVRDELEDGTGIRVSESALRWGFLHAGRFSIEYRKRFGESPSATLARRRKW